MDGGQFRVPQRTSRGTVSRPEPTRRPVENPQPRVETPAEEAPVKPVSTVRQTKNTREKASSQKPKRRIGLVIAAVCIVLLVVGGWFALSMLKNAAPGIDSSKYQAVFLVNGDIYFGKLEPAGKDYLKLTKIYYIQSPTKDSSDEQSQQTATDQNNVQLIKLGEEIYGPEDAMTISRDQVMLYENLKPDSKVSKAIDSYDKK